MSKHKILVVWSNYYKDLAKKQLDSCLLLLEKSSYDTQVEQVDAGTYEIPAVIQHYQRHNPYDGYLPLGLLLQGSTDHYAFIWEHVKTCFIQFAMEGVLIGNGIISAARFDHLTERVESNERTVEAYNALRYLIQLKEKIR
ncbi:MAG: 6,7-dimethyl-8-ribityllumazine synthase [Tatlockia sp.]|jgi:6,7-dimethyl-8-ribityllumazine synthase